MKTKAETGKMQPQAKACPGPLKAGKGKGGLVLGLVISKTVRE